MMGELLGDTFETESQRSVAARALDTIDGEPTEIDGIQRGNRKQTAIARFADHGPVVVQICTEKTWLESESTLLRQIRTRTDVPVPPVLRAGSNDGIAYMITAYVAGGDLHERFTGVSATVQRELARSFGRYLAELHEQFTFGGYGALVVSGDRLTAQRPDWETWLREYGRRAVSRLPPAFEPVRTDCRGLFSELPADSAPTARLFPWDFRPGNALIAEDTVTAILDWEAPLAAPASLSVAKAEYLVADWYVDEPEPLRAAFRSGYERIRPYPSIPAAHRVAVIADTAVDSSGTVTNPGYPEAGHDAAVEFHRAALADAVRS